MWTGRCPGVRGGHEGHGRRAAEAGPWRQVGKVHPRGQIGQGWGQGECQQGRGQEAVPGPPQPASEEEWVCRAEQGSLRAKPATVCCTPERGTPASSLPLAQQASPLFPAGGSPPHQGLMGQAAGFQGPKGLTASGPQPTARPPLPPRGHPRALAMALTSKGPAQPPTHSRGSSQELRDSGPPEAFPIPSSSPHTCFPSSPFSAAPGPCCTQS